MHAMNNSTFHVERRNKNAYLNSRKTTPKLISFFFDKQFYVSKYMCPVPIRVAPLRIMGATCLTVWERSYGDEKGEKWKEHCVSDHGRRRDVNSQFSTYGYKDIQMLCAHICVYMYPHGNIPKLWPKTRPGTSGFTMLLRMPSTLILALN